MAAARTRSPAVPRKRQSPEARREEFIRKAAEFFAEEGFAGGTRELAAKLGVTQPLLYRYFPSKEELIQAVYRRVYLDRWNPEWDALLADRSRPIRERLQKFYEAYTDAIFDREWLRIYLASGLAGAEINRWYVSVVETRILTRIVAEFRNEAGLPAQEPPAPGELELAWILQGGIFYYGVRKYIFDSPVQEDKARVISNALDIFFEGIAKVFGAKTKVRTRAVRRA
ncbi:MAG: TetR/AcrR family transcriptional regulator [Hyphomicrobiales bacterium]|nr:TetR/AcrR family transcriptional regulator [Hyphomicrobiales bacterium]